MLHVFLSSLLHDSTPFRPAVKWLIVLLGLGLGTSLCVIFGFLASVEEISEDEDGNYAPVPCPQYPVLSRRA